MIRTLKGKISLIYIGLVMLIIIIGLSGFFNLYRMEKAVDGLMVHNYKSIDAISRMTEALERQDGAMLMYINIDRKKALELFSDNYADFARYYQIEENNITEQGEKRLVEELDGKYREYVGYFLQLQEYASQNGDIAPASFYHNTVLPQFNRIKQSLSDLRTLNEKSMFDSKRITAENVRRSMYWLLLLSFTTAAAGFAVSRYFANRLLSPLNRLTESISRVKAGELDQQIDIRSDDEAGKLAREFNEMTQRLQNYEKSTLGTLMAERNKTMAIVKSMSDPMLVLDMNYRIVLINDACEYFFGITEAEAAGRHFLEAIRNGELFDHISDAAESGGEHGERVLSVNRDKEYYFNVAVTPVGNAEQKNAGLIVVLHDVTEFKELERVKTDFIATISHEFKTPLTSIMMAASMLLENGMGELNGDQRETLEALKEDGDRLSCLVSELLELSRIESGGAVYDMRPCSVRDIAEAALKGFKENAGKRGVRIADRMAEQLPPVRADFGKIQWVFNNLISNALKYTGPGDTITIEAAEEKERVVVSVKDTGAGIPPEYLERIFDKYVQVKGRDIEVRGTGLGLSVAREIIGAHNGTIRAESELNNGSTFTFTLPVYREEEP
jgi:PAS domain S-box-containing protein